MLDNKYATLRNRKLLPIGPWSLDPQSDMKRQVISDECKQYSWTIAWPVDANENKAFLIEPWLLKISDVTLVLADLSFERPSCYFELGCVEALNKTVAVIASAGTPIHQTSHRDSVIFFSGLAEYRRVVRKLVST
jgi:hypothetical protein